MQAPFVVPVDISGVTLSFRPAHVEAQMDETEDSGMEETGGPAKAKRKQQVFTLLVEVGRKTGDGLPDKATGAGLVIYASGVDEAEAVRETVAILKQADLAPLDVSGYGTLEERKASGDEIDAEELELMERALKENSVIVAQMTPFFD